MREYDSTLGEGWLKVLYESHAHSRVALLAMGVWACANGIISLVCLFLRARSSVVPGLSPVLSKDASLCLAPIGPASPPVGAVLRWSQCSLALPFDSHVAAPTVS